MPHRFWTRPLSMLTRLSCLVLLMGSMSTFTYAELSAESIDSRPDEAGVTATEAAPPHKKKFDCVRSFCGCSKQIEIPFQTTVVSKELIPQSKVKVGCSASNILGLTDESGKVSFIIKTTQSTACGIACKSVTFVKDTFTSYKTWIVSVSNSNGRLTMLDKPWQIGEMNNGIKNGKWQEWCTNGQQSVSGNYRNDVKHGEWLEWHCNGPMKTQGTYLNDKKEGVWIQWYEDGQMNVQGEYHDDKRQGKWTSWYPNGQLESEGEWRKDKRIGTSIYYNREGQKTFISD